MPGLQRAMRAYWKPPKSRKTKRYKGVSQPVSLRYRRAERTARRKEDAKIRRRHRKQIATNYNRALEIMEQEGYGKQQED